MTKQDHALLEWINAHRRKHFVSPGCLAAYNQHGISRREYVHMLNIWRRNGKLWEASS